MISSYDDTGYYPIYNYYEQLAEVELIDNYKEYTIPVNTKGFISEPKDKPENRNKGPTDRESIIFLNLKTNNQ